MTELRTGPTGRDLRRLRLRRLDACLEHLELARERGELLVHAGLAAAVRVQVPQVEAGMRMDAAQELVLRAQEPYLGRDDDWRVVAARPSAGDGPAEVDGDRTQPREPPLTHEQARLLTERIRDAAGRACRLLLEAHRRRAWSALGHPTWAQYVRSELGLSRSRSYELLDQARVGAALRTAAGAPGVPDISAFAAAELKSRLGEVAEAVRVRTAGASPEAIPALVAEVVREHRAALRGVLSPGRAATVV